MALTAFVSHTTVDCRNAYELSEWWKPVLGYVDIDGDPNLPGHEECMIRRPRDRPPAAVHRGARRQGRSRTASTSTCGRARPPATRSWRGCSRTARPSSPTCAARTAPAPAGWCSPTRRATSSASCAPRPRQRSRRGRTPAAILGPAQTRSAPPPLPAYFDGNSDDLWQTMGMLPIATMVDDFDTTVGKAISAYAATQVSSSSSSSSSKKKKKKRAVSPGRRRRRRGRRVVVTPVTRTRVGRRAGKRSPGSRTP